jgi:hypothetical protein
MRQTLISTAVLSLVLTPSICTAQQIESRIVQPRAIPAEAAYTGNLVAARSWTDALGENLLILSLTDELPSRGEYGRDIETYGYHYLRREGGYALLWRTTDFVRKCDLDMTLKVGPRTVAITDLDADGTAETTFMYIMGCYGGVDPLTMKLLMHEGATKYAIRGSTDLSVELHSPDYASEMNIDPSLRDGPAAFREFAVRHWNRFKRYSPWFAED